MAWEIRSATPADAAAIAGLLAQLGYVLASNDIAGRLAGGDAAALVADGGGRILGVLGYDTRWYLHKNGLITSIDSLVVDGEFRSRGIGEALVNAACEMARAGGVQVVDLHSHVSREDARRFYERIGFAVTSNYFVKNL